MNNYIKDILHSYKDFFPNEREKYSLLERQIQQKENIWTRKNFSGHLTASAYLLDKSLEKILLVHNINLDKWLAPGGHWEEGDGEMQNNAMREALEETGLKDIALHEWHSLNKNIPIDIDTHYIPENPKKGEKEHFHHDFRYVFIYKGDTLTMNVQKNEVKGYQWISINDNLNNFSGKSVLQKIKAFVLK